MMFMNSNHFNMPATGARTDASGFDCSSIREISADTISMVSVFVIIIDVIIGIIINDHISYNTAEC